MSYANTLMIQSTSTKPSHKLHTVPVLVLVSLDLAFLAYEHTSHAVVTVMTNAKDVVG